MTAVLRYLWIASCLWFLTAGAQDTKVQWLTLEQSEDSLTINPKKVFIDFYTDWCTYCRKMDRVVFTKPEVVDALNTSYYAVRFNAEQTSPVRLEGHVLINDQLGKTRRPIHQLAQLLATREGEFTPPVLLILDQDFRVAARYFEYLDSMELIEVLR